MDGPGRGRGPTAATLLLLVAVAGCEGSGEPPFAELSLRDALRADPDAIAALDEDVRERLANRFEDARLAQRAEARVARTAAETADGYATIADAPREAIGDEAVVVWQIAARDADVRLATLALSGDAGTSRGGAAALEVVDPILSDPPYAGAIEGGARAALLDVASQTGATRLISIEQVPVAMIADGTELYVNLAWLLAMHASGPEEVGATSAPLTGTPYDLGTVAECVEDVNARCADCLAGTCDGDPELEDFGTLAEECAYLGADATRPVSLCVLGMMSVRSVSSCVARLAPACVPLVVSPRSGSIDAAFAFASTPDCAVALEACVADRYAPAAMSSGGSSCIDDACDSACDSACDDSCDLSLCDSDVCECSVGARRRGSRERFAPLWLVAPLVVAFQIARRR